MDAEMDWRRPDVTAIVKFNGLASGVPDELDRLVLWLEQQGYTIVRLDGSKGQRELRRQLGVLLKWAEEFGYRFEDGEGT
ncbi:MAG: hypothetical protein HYZ29_07910 [Myxococcales bacterium]|nr:hypothetical protein [Myxococcales bacterium]